MYCIIRPYTEGRLDRYRIGIPRELSNDLCIFSLCSAGLQQLLSICDQYCASHSLTFNVSKSVCIFFESRMNKLCDNISVELDGNNIDFVHEIKYLSVIINSSMTSSDVVCQTT